MSPKESQVRRNDINRRFVQSLKPKAGLLQLFRCLNILSLAVLVTPLQKLGFRAEGYSAVCKLQLEDYATCLENYAYYKILKLRHAAFRSLPTAPYSLSPGLCQACCKMQLPLFQSTHVSFIQNCVGLAQEHGI